jgi:hypothetical protein
MAMKNAEKPQHLYVVSFAPRREAVPKTGASPFAVLLYAESAQQATQQALDVVVAKHTHAESWLWPSRRVPLTAYKHKVSGPVELAFVIGCRWDYKHHVFSARKIKIPPDTLIAPGVKDSLFWPSYSG